MISAPGQSRWLLPRSLCKFPEMFFSSNIRFIIQAQLRPLLLLFGILSISFGGILITSVSQTTLITAERALGGYWRTSYDILVRPAGSRLPIEEQYNLVEPNHLSGIWGGITFEQYEAIKAIPGVEVAAPIAMIGYVSTWAFGDSMDLPHNPGVYIIEETMMINDGCRIYTIPGSQPQTFNYYDSEHLFGPYEYNRILSESGIALRDRPRLGGSVSFPILMGGIDPLQETVLVPLDQSILQGRYLRSDESLEPKITLVPREGYEGKPIQQPINLPILINAATYVDLLHLAGLKYVILPPGVASLEEILARGGISYLETLPVEEMGNIQMDSQAIYQRLIEQITPKIGLPGQTTPVTEMVLGAYAALSTPSHLVYRESAPPFRYDGLALTLQLPEGQEGQTFPKYRASLAPGESEFDIAYYWDVVGIFDIEQIPQPAEVSGVPLETYFPPTAILRYDEQGSPVESPCTLRPTLSAEGYIQPPPLVLTTLEAARALRGEAAISAIRVRVGDVDRLTPANQRKIEAIAIQIAKQTGLDVDIMVGSSPTRVLVHVPEIGYVEEQWIQKGVNLVYKRGIQTGNWLLLGTLLLAGSLFTLDMAWAEALSRRRLIVIQKALGWRSRTVFTQILVQITGIGVIATSLGTMIALALIRWLEWESVPPNLLIALPLLVLGLCIVGSLPPAWSASRMPPIIELQRGGMRYEKTQAGSVSNLWRYAWSEIKRRRARSVLTGMGSALSAGLLTLLLGVTLQQRGMLGGTLLGEFILVNIEGYHYAIVGIGLGLAFLSTFNGLLGSILERRREIGVLKAVGWQTVSVACLFILQGMLLGVIGGSVGALAGMLAFLYFYQSISSSLGLAILLGISLPGLVGALAALYPARLAASVPPAEAVRHE